MGKTPEQPSTLPTATDLCTTSFTLKEWLTFHRNTWMRNLAANLIDIKRDSKQDANAPTAEVKENVFGQPIDKDGNPIAQPDQTQLTYVTFGERMQRSRSNAAQSIQIIEATTELSDMTDADLTTMTDAIVAAHNDAVQQTAVAAQAQAPEAQTAPAAPDSPAPETSQPETTPEPTEAANAPETPAQEQTEAPATPAADATQPAPAEPAQPAA